MITDLRPIAADATTPAPCQRIEPNPGVDVSKLLDAVEQAVIATDLGGSITYWNRFAETLYGWRAAEVLGRNSVEVTPSAMTRTQAAEMMARLTAGASWSGEFEVRRKDGTTFPAHVTDSPIRDAAGNLVGVIRVSRDITARKQAEAMLQASEKRLRSVLATAPVAMFESRPGWGGTSVNPAWSTLTGLNPEPGLGDGDGWMRAVHPEDLSVVAACWEHAQATGEPFTLEFRIVRPDGEQRTVECRVAPLPGRHGPSASWVGTLIDLTERKRAEAALRLSQDRLRQAVSVAGLGTWDWDIPSGEVQQSAEMNAIAGLATEDCGGTQGDFRQRLHPDDRDVVNQSLPAVATGREGDDYRVEFRLVRPDGEVRWVDSAARVYRDAEGRATQLVGTSLDITERKAAEAQRETLVRSERLRALGQMASGVAHDLNQQFVLISGYGGLVIRALEAAGFDEPEVAEGLQIMKRAALDGGETVKRLLTFARGREAGAPEPIEVSAFLSDVALLTAPRWRNASQLEGRSIDLAVEAPPGLLILGWPHALREALTNLVFNAVDAMPRGGSITLRACERRGRVLIEVIDTGTGMSPDVQTHLFEPFFTTKGERGNGLGLSSVHAIVERHEGLIVVESSMGRGTTFRFDLPRWYGPVPSDPSAPAQAERKRGLQVLAVDDEAAVGTMVRRVLRLDGHQVTTATSGEQALELIQGHAGSFDLVVSDLSMGSGMSGWDLAAAVRQRWPDMHFVLATGWGASIDPSEARTRGVDVVISKPYTVEALQGLVNSFV